MRGVGFPRIHRELLRQVELRARRMAEIAAQLAELTGVTSKAADHHSLGNQGSHEGIIFFVFRIAYV